MSRAPARWQSAGAMVVLLVAVVLLVVLDPFGDDSGDEPGPAEPSAPAAPTPEEFCEGFRALATAQGQYAANADDPATVDALREAAESLVATGVPDEMTLPARGGYFTVINGVYGSVDLDLTPAEVGALEDPGAGADAAFANYLTQYCPP